MSIVPLSGCTGDTGPQGEQGLPGDPGDPGDPGVSCTVVDNLDGTKTITCGTAEVTVSDGVAGIDGDSCTGVNNGDGTFTITCDTATIVLTDPAFVPAAYTAADGIAGGTAFAKWWLTQAGGGGTLTAEGVTVGAEWVRCKTCHGWDGLGNEGSYANRTGQSTGTASRPDVSTINLRTTIAATTPQQLFDLVLGAGGRAINTQSNRHPDFSGVLTDDQVWNLVKFMREEWIFPDTLYYLAVDGPPVYTPTGGGAPVAPTLTYYGVGTDGDPTAGAAVFTASCQLCHGANGTSINIGGTGVSLGEFVRTKPHEAWHKAKFGLITDSSVEEMAPGLVVDTIDLVDLYSALADSANFPDL